MLSIWTVIRLNINLLIYSFILLFTGNTGEQHGYSDHFTDEGIFNYTGEGQVGDMPMVRGNKAIRDNVKDGRAIHVFEYVRKAYVRARAEGDCDCDCDCEGCNTSAPFISKKGPYLEPHHVHRLADGGPDHPKNVIALCPNCHRQAHYSTDAFEFNRTLVKKLTDIEK